MLDISSNAKISKLADIEDSIKGTKITISDDVTIDSFVKIKPAGGNGDIFIDKHCYINSGVVMYSGNGIKIGKGVLVAANCTFAPVNHEFSSKHKTIIEQRFKSSKGGIIIEDDVWIGANVVLLDGTTIRKGAVIGAGAIISGEIEAYTINVGNPLKKIGERT